MYKEYWNRLSTFNKPIQDIKIELNKQLFDIVNIRNTPKGILYTLHNRETNQYKSYYDDKLINKCCPVIIGML